MSDGKEVKRWWLRQNYRRKTWYVSGSDTYPRRDTDIAVMPVEDHDRIVAELRAEVVGVKVAMHNAASGLSMEKKQHLDTIASYSSELRKADDIIATQARVIEKLKTMILHDETCSVDYYFDKVMPCNCGLEKELAAIEKEGAKDE